MSLTSALLQTSEPFSLAAEDSLHPNRACTNVIRVLCVLILVGAVNAADAVGSQSENEVFPAIEGEILENALEYCRRGERAQAHALFQSIREQLNPPLPVLELIANAEASGCLPEKSLPSVLWGVQLGGGYDTNVNQGIIARSMVVGSGLNAIELELGDAYKPRPSAYAVAGLDAGFRIGEVAIGQIALQHRDNFSVPALNLTSLVVSAIRPFRWFERAGRVQVDYGENWLGGNHYLRTGSAGAQWVMTEGVQPWLASLATLRTSYTDQPNQDSLLTEAGIWRQRQLASAFGLFGGVSALYDHAFGQRPGGDRAGWRYQLGATISFSEWLIQPGLNVLRWQSSNVFSPGLIDLPRRHQMAQISLQAVRQLAPNQQLVFEWRFNQAKDTVPLFSYRAQTLGVYWRLLR